MKHTSEVCTAFIPAELIEHLWNIVDLYDDDNFVFVLSSRRLGDGLVQDIKVFIGNSSSFQTVFGYKPVDFTVKVCKNGDELVMSLTPSTKAAHEIDKWKSRRSYLLFQKKIAAAMF